MIDLKIKHKTDFYLAIGFFLFINIHSILNYAVVSFPKQESLSYSVGVLGLKDNVRHTKHLTLYDVQDNKESMVFACGYSFFSNGSSSGCGSEFYTPYLNKEATIGWYIPDKFLIFKNDLPQMVSLEVEDKVIISYSDTIDKIHSRNNIYKFFSLSALPLSILMYFILIRIEKIYKQRNNKLAVRVRKEF